MNINKTLTYAAAFVIAMIILLSGSFVIAPQVDATVAARAETAQVDAQNAAKTAQIAQLADQFTAIDVLRNELAVLQAGIPTSADTPTLLRQLGALAETHGVTLDSISISESQAAAVAAAADAVAADVAAVTETADTADTADTAGTAVESAMLAIPVSLSISGDSGAIRRFIEGMQTSDRIMSVTEFSTSIGEESATASISAVAYALSGS